MDLNGTDRQVHYSDPSTTSAPYVIYKFRDMLYWTDENRGGIGAINITSGEEVGFATELFGNGQETFDLSKQMYGLTIGRTLNVNYCCAVTCLEGATCVNQEYKALCICTPYFKGKRCELDLDECSLPVDTYPCDLTHGTCSNTYGSYECGCQDGYQFSEGTQCLFTVDCSGDPCANGGSCMDDTCLCMLGFTGKTCEQVDYCRDVTCLSGGKCVSQEYEALCICTPYFKGTRCELDVDECSLPADTYPCDQTHGTCNNTYGLYECGCQDGYHISEETQCVFTVKCFGYPCRNGGACMDDTCFCMLGFMGNYCELDVDECSLPADTYPCDLTHGTCINTYGWYECGCEDGYHFSEETQCALTAITTERTLYSTDASDTSFSTQNTVECPPLASPINGSAIVRGFSAGDVAVFTCDEGFEISHDITLTCEPSGRWSDGDMPHCSSAPGPTEITEVLQAKGFPVSGILTIVGLVIFAIVTSLVIFFFYKKKKKSKNKVGPTDIDLAPAKDSDEQHIMDSEPLCNQDSAHDEKGLCD